MYESLEFEIWIFKMTSNGETTKMKVVVLEKLCNFIVDNFSFELYFLNYAFSNF
jgi:hypothetical protein